MNGFLSGDEMKIYGIMMSLFFFGFFGVRDADSSENFSV
jgi:hypothetical protein